MGGLQELKPEDPQCRAAGPWAALVGREARGMAKSHRVCGFAMVHRSVSNIWAVITDDPGEGNIAEV